MTTSTQPPDDEPFDQVERQIDWIEQLENVRARHETLAAARAAVAYVDNLHDLVRKLAGRQTYEDLQLLHGTDLANLITAIRNRDASNDWDASIRPGLLRES